MYQVTVVWYTICIYIYMDMDMAYTAYTAYTACIGMPIDGNWLRARWRCHEIVKVAPCWGVMGDPPGMAMAIDGHGMIRSQKWKR